ncbi:MAG TPA: hypothetical protein ENO22_06910 [candidate division Zixibacteria bacterium]|nr:hypothetical protein [candidate division Zixibacteria bacterium]
MDNIVDLVLSKIGSVVGGTFAEIGAYHDYLYIRFGPDITMAIYLCALILLLVVVFKIFKLAFNLLRFVLIPALVAGYIAATFFSVNLLSVLPIAGAAFSFLFLLKA